MGVNFNSILIIIGSCPHIVNSVLKKPLPPPSYSGSEFLYGTVNYTGIKNSLGSGNQSNPG